MQIAPLAYRILLGIFLPGCLALLPVYLMFENAQHYINGLLISNESSGLTLTIFFFSALILGNIVEAFRYVSFDIILNRIFYGKKSARYSKNMKSEADIKFYELVFDTSYAPYQFYLNSAIILIITLFVIITKDNIQISGNYIFIIILTIITLLGAAVRATYGASERIKSKFNFKIEDDDKNEN